MRGNGNKNAANTGPQRNEHQTTTQRTLDHDAANTETEHLAQRRRQLGSLHNEP
ncbi:uncharacterized protein G2W53_015234 [Senna tora]|uniref:Uncharacterized protein n=1 Tax=Senna tora TaxID=362788 RepID=A0A835C3Y2_9FABA|nr:uncharacterized protein G2W53_015234 [Senna tora]